MSELKTLSARAKNMDVSDLRARVRPFAEAATRAAQAARHTVRERAPSSDEVLKGLGLERRRSRSGILSWPLLLAASAGAALAFFLDPQQGARRRAVTRDKVVAAANDLSRVAARTGRIAAARAQGLTSRMTTLVPAPAEPANDATLIARVESEAFRGTERDLKGFVNLNSVDGKVFIRGEVPKREQISQIEKRVRRVRGVKDVENLMHLPGTQAPTAP